MARHRGRAGHRTAAYAKAHRIELPTDGTDWHTAYSTTTGAGHLDGPLHRRLPFLIPFP
ncbi:hypothetical protein AB0F30_31940 [Streptomyces sp. NPDC029006]|uniref:hypothetical protein n=1 Tax=Streptomyces sp. NPDC029006 TaxID=3155467 RepID=UPI0033CFDB5E